MQEIWVFLAGTFNQFMADNATILSVAIIMMFLDIVSGFVVALIQGNYSSTIMREGLGHKFGYIMCMCAVAVIQLAMFDPAFEVNFSLPLFNGVCAFIIFMEFTSIIENAALISPSIEKIFGKFLNKKEDSDNDNEVVDLDQLDIDEIEQLVLKNN